MIALFEAIFFFGFGLFIGYIVGKEQALEWVNKTYRQIEKESRNGTKRN